MASIDTSIRVFELAEFYRSGWIGEVERISRWGRKSWRGARGDIARSTSGKPRSKRKSKKRNKWEYCVTKLFSRKHVCTLDNFGDFSGEGVEGDCRQDTRWSSPWNFRNEARSTDARSAQETAIRSEEGPRTNRCVCLLGCRHAIPNALRHTCAIESMQSDVSMLVLAARSWRLIDARLSRPQFSSFHVALQVCTSLSRVQSCLMSDTKRSWRCWRNKCALTNRTSTYSMWMTLTIWPCVAGRHDDRLCWQVMLESEKAQLKENEEDQLAESREKSADDQLAQVRTMLFGEHGIWLNPF